MSKNKGIGKFIAGAAIGVGLGFLFAPKSGAETRKDLKKKLDELINQVKEIDVKDVRDAFVRKIDDIKAEIADLDKEKVASIAKEKAEEIKEKMEDLLQEAKAKATPVIKKTTAGIKDKTVEVLKKTVDKLENDGKGTIKKSSKKEKATK